MYDEKVFEFIGRQEPSGRGELEITDVNNEYIKRGEMEYDVLKGGWTDAGTFESLQIANQMLLGCNNEILWLLFSTVALSAAKSGESADYHRQTGGSHRIAFSFLKEFVLDY